MEQKEISVEQQQSVEISVNAKGQYSGKVKCYDNNLDTAYQKAVDKALQLESLINTKNG